MLVENQRDKTLHSAVRGFFYNCGGHMRLLNYLFPWSIFLALDVGVELR
jgi:hypothetical protein